MAELNANPPCQPSAPIPTASSGSTLNLDDILERLGGDWDLLNDICDIFVAEAPAMISAVQEAVTLQDARALERAAHSLKGAVSAFSDHDCFEAALSMERMGRENDLESAQSLFTPMKDKVDRLVGSILCLREAPIPCPPERDNPHARSVS